METHVFEPLQSDSGSTTGGGDVSVTTVGDRQNGPSVTVTEAGDPWTGDGQQGDPALTTDVDVQGAGLIDSWLAGTSVTQQDVDMALSAAMTALMLATLYYSMEGGR